MKTRLISERSLEKTPTLKAQSAVYNSLVGKEKISTIGGILVDKYKFKYGLGTCHGLKRQFVENQTEFMDDRDDEINIHKDDTLFGKIKAILFTDDIDIALVRIDGRRKMDNFILDNSIIGNPTKTYTPSVSDEKKLEIVLFSDIQDAKDVEGVLIEANTSCVFNFTADGKVQKTFNNLMSISTNTLNGKSLTHDGDSGTWVRTKDKNEVIGMVIGAKDDKTYVMKMDTILKACETELKINLNLLIIENDEKINN